MYSNYFVFSEAFETEALVAELILAEKEVVSRILNSAAMTIAIVKLDGLGSYSPRRSYLPPTFHLFLFLLHLFPGIILLYNFYAFHFLNSLFLRSTIKIIIKYQRLYISAGQALAKKGGSQPHYYILRRFHLILQ